MRALCIAALCAGVALAAAAGAAAQIANPTEPAIWSGVFSAAQAERGRVLMAAHCTQCHGAGRSLVGDLFMLHWEGHDLARLLRKVQDMPPGARKLAPEQSLDVMARLLELNGFPAGDRDLPQEEDALKAFVVLPQGGPRPMRSGAVAEVIGCLTEAAPYRWRLTGATEPVPVALEEAGAVPDQAAAPPSGTQTFDLLNPFPSPAPHVGRIVVVRGLLIRNPSGDRLNVVSLAPLAASCAP